MLILNCFQMSEDYNVIGSERQFADRLPGAYRNLKPVFVGEVHPYERHDALVAEKPGRDF